MADSVIGRLIYKITGDTSALNSSLDSSRAKISQTGQSLQQMSGKIKTLATTAISGYLIKSMLEASSRAEELGNKFDTVFSGMESSADNWARTYASATSRGVLATKEFLATQQDIRTGYGDSVAQAAKFSQAVVGVSNDLASFSNIPVDEAMQAVNSGLSQQFEALRRLGVGLNVQIINQGAYAKALGKTWDEMNNLERQEAILSGIVSQSKNALHQEIQLWQDYNYTLGDASVTSESYANSTQGLKQSFEDMKAELGDAVLPLVTDLTGIVLNGVKAFNSWDDSMQTLTASVVAFGAAMLTVGGPLGVVVGSLGALAVISSKNQSATDSLSESTRALKDASQEYNSVIETLGGNTDGLTASEQALLQARRAILKLEMTQQMEKIASSYEKATVQIQAQNEMVDVAEAQVYAYQVALRAIDGDWT